jgi:sulfate transport system substrate-binding protein
MSLRPKLLALGLLGVVALSACGSSSSASSSGGAGTVDLVAYSTPKPAYDQLIRAFNATPAGKGVGFTSSYGASGDQARSVISGLDAGYVAFSLQTDMDKLVKAGKVATSWNSGPTKGFVTDSVVVFVVRKGNPKHIESWADLVKPDVKVITPNPFSSGSARWNILAAYGQVTESGGTSAQGEAFLRKLFANIVTQPASGREATQAFTSGTGDVLLSYENEAIFARQKGQPVDYVVPATTLLLQNPAAVTVGSPAAATSFLNYVLSTPGQTIFAQSGYRPVVPGINATVQGANDPANPFPTPAHQFTIAQLGGWKAVTDTFFDTKTGVITAIEQQKGVPIDKK